MNEAKTIQDSVKIKTLMEFYGIQFNKRGFAKCPFHTEKSSSLSIKNEHFKCFGCGEYGGSIDFVMKYFNLPFRAALSKIDNDFNLKILNKKMTAREKRILREETRLKQAINIWHNNKKTLYNTLSDVHRILFRRYSMGEQWLQQYVTELNILLDDFNYEEVRMWEMIFR